MDEEGYLADDSWAGLRVVPLGYDIRIAGIKHAKHRR
jgi:hypothetical protein